MRPDHQKLNATQKEGAKDQAKDLENRRQSQAASKRGHEPGNSGQGYVRRRDGRSDGKSEPHADG